MNVTTMSDDGTMWSITTTLGERAARRLAEFDSGRTLYISVIFDDAHGVRTYVYRSRA